MTRDKYFAIAMLVDRGKKGKALLEIPFNGDPGDLKGRVFHGTVANLGEGSREVGTLEGSVLGIGNDSR